MQMRFVFFILTVCICSPALAYYTPYYYAPQPLQPPVSSQPAYYPPAQNSDSDENTAPNQQQNYSAPYGSAPAAPINDVNAPAGNLQPLTVNWGDKDINWQDLQTLFMEHPDETAFIFRFPNGYNWRVSPQEVRAFYTTIVSQSASMGLVGSADFSFSSVTQQLSVTCCNSKPSTASPQ